MTKILTIGANTRDSQMRTSMLARERNLPYKGLIHDINNIEILAGVYTTSIAHIQPGDVMKIAGNFDEIVLLDQSREEHTHPKILLTSYKLMVELEKRSNHLGIRTKFRDNKNIEVLDKWTEFFKTNKSFCAYPFLSYSDANPFVATCARGQEKIANLGELDDWKTNANYQRIRTAMINGEKLPKNCQVCYDYEDNGLTSYRVHDSLDYIAILGINDIEDFKKIENPYYYEMRVSDKCNLMCRMCSPNHSHLLKEEFRKNPGLTLDQQEVVDDWKTSNIDVIPVDTLTDKHLVYLTGGEPLVMADVYKFMRRCIDAKRTDFGLTLGTNAMAINETFMDLAKHFSNLHFSVSIDGYGKVNDYVRWKSDFDTIISNCHKLRSAGHQITWNHVPTIWGIHRTHELFEYLSDSFPDVSLYLQYNRVDLHSAYKSPLVEETLKSLERTKQTTLYFSDGKDCTSGIDSFYDHYQNYKPDLEHLKRFFAWNDRMDAARGIALRDYIPDLDDCRKLI